MSTVMKAFSFTEIHEGRHGSQAEQGAAKKERGREKPSADHEMQEILQAQKRKGRTALNKV